jgi:hypothetical protein
MLIRFAFSPRLIFSSASATEPRIPSATCKPVAIGAATNKKKKKLEMYFIAIFDWCKKMR